MDTPMDPETLALYIAAGVLSTIGFVMLYLEGKKNRPKKDATPQDATPEEKPAPPRKSGKKGRAKK